MPPISRRAAIRIALGLLVLLVSCGTAALGYRTYDQATDYPGAVRVAQQTITNFMPNLVLRRTSVYRTNDAFNKVYNWYSKRFALGPESYAQSNCILMSRSSTRGWGLEEQMSVMACNTPNGQMMFVSRAFMIRYPRW